MGNRIFSTEYAPVEEIEGVKKSLTEAGIGFYEVANSKLWLGGGALYVNDPKDHARAREVIEAFQEDWRRRARANPVPATLNWKLISPLILILVVFIAVTLNSLLG